MEGPEAPEKRTRGEAPAADDTAAGIPGWLEELAGFRDREGEGLTRLALTEWDLLARRWFVERAQGLGLRVRTDRFANLFAHSPEAPDEGPFALSGSHLDSVVNAGRFDGTLGVALALHAVASQPGPNADGMWPAAVSFTCEESSRFSAGCLGSRLWSGEAAWEDVAPLADREGVTFEEALAGTREAMAGWPGLREAPLPPEHVRAFYEAHVEQGGELEAAGRAIGLVTAIAAPSRWLLTFHGVQGHSGGAGMEGRRDALAAAAEAVLAAERVGNERAASGLRCTVGVIQAHPGVINTIPGRVVIGLDVRSTVLADVDAAHGEILAAAREAAGRRGVEVTERRVWRALPYRVPEAVYGRLAAAAAAAGEEPLPMVSRGGHDAMYVGRRVPSGMLFVRNPAGVSHHPDEACREEDIVRAARVLQAALAG